MELPVVRLVRGLVILVPVLGILLLVVAVPLVVALLPVGPLPAVIPGLALVQVLEPVPAFALPVLAPVPGFASAPLSRRVGPQAPGVP
jgi:hypothetical protein